MAKELEAAISDRDSLKKNHQAVGQEMEQIKAQLALTQAKWVLCGAKSVILQYILGQLSRPVVSQLLH